MPGNTDGSWGWAGGTPGIFSTRRRLCPFRKLVEQLDQVVGLRGGAHFAHEQTFERELGCEPQECGDGENQSVKQQALCSLGVQVGIQVIGDLQQGLGVFDGAIRVNEFLGVLSGVPCVLFCGEASPLPGFRVVFASKVIRKLQAPDM